jgi:hypothetical protein
MSRHVVLLRRDPSLGLALRALLHGTGLVTEILTVQAWTALPANGIDAVVIDLPMPRRRQAVEAVRSRFTGRLVLVLDPADDPDAIAAHHNCSVVQRPFEIVELWQLVTTDPTPGAPSPAAGEGRAGEVSPAAQPERGGAASVAPSPAAAAEGTPPAVEGSAAAVEGSAAVEGRSGAPGEASPAAEKPSPSPEGERSPSAARASGPAVAEEPPPAVAKEPTPAAPEGSGRSGEPSSVRAGDAGPSAGPPPDQPSGSPNPKPIARRRNRPRGSPNPPIALRPSPLPPPEVRSHRVRTRPPL